MNRTFQKQADFPPFSKAYFYFTVISKIHIQSKESMNTQGMWYARFEFACFPNSRDRIVVSTLRCGRSNPGSNPGHGSCKKAVSAGTISFGAFFGI